MLTLLNEALDTCNSLCVVPDKVGFSFAISTDEGDFRPTEWLEREPAFLRSMSEKLRHILATSERQEEDMNRGK